MTLNINICVSAETKDRSPKQKTLQCSATQILFTKIVLQDKFMHYKFAIRTISKSIFLIMYIAQCNLEFNKTQSNFYYLLNTMFVTLNLLLYKYPLWQNISICFPYE